jgi:hypothetical protein
MQITKLSKFNKIDPIFFYHLTRRDLDKSHRFSNQMKKSLWNRSALDRFLWNWLFFLWVRFWLILKSFRFFDMVRFRQFFFSKKRGWDNYLFVLHYHHHRHHYQNKIIKSSLYAYHTLIATCCQTKPAIYFQLICYNTTYTNIYMYLLQFNTYYYYTSITNKRCQYSSI